MPFRENHLPPVRLHPNQQKLDPPPSPPSKLQSVEQKMIARLHYPPPPRRTSPLAVLHRSQLKATSPSPTAPTPAQKDSDGHFPADLQVQSKSHSSIIITLIGIVHLDSKEDHYTAEERSLYSRKGSLYATRGSLHSLEEPILDTYHQNQKPYITSITFGSLLHQGKPTGKPQEV